MLTLSTPATGGAAEAAGESVVHASSSSVAVARRASDILGALRLRYDVYRAAGYLPASAARVDADAYDPRSSILVGKDGAAIAGTVRVIAADRLSAPPRDLVPLVVAVAGDRALAEHVATQRSASLPSIVSDEVAARIADLNPRGMPICELSRLVVLRAAQGTGLASRLVELGSAVAWRRGPALLVGSCLPERVGAYARRYGYRPLRDPADGLDYFPSVGQHGCVIACRPDDMPRAMRERVERLAQEIGDES